MAFKNQVMKIIILSFFSFLGSVLHGQGNLQFNQVINLPFVANNTTPVTVPTGKVWKLESCMLNGAGNGNAFMTYNGALYNMRQQQTSTQVANFPFWLSSGASVTFGTSSSGGILSILEFNIVP
jgi:hypothetical protein